MKRALKSVDKRISCDVLIIGGGLAGCLAALEAKEALGPHGKVAIIDKGFLSRSGQSAFAAGIWTFFDPDQDDRDLWLEEIITSGEYLNDQLWCRQLYDLGHVVARKLDGWATEIGETIFEKNAKGEMIRRKSRGHNHTKHVVINSLTMMAVLRRKLMEKGIRIHDRIMMTDLFCDESGASGAMGFDYQQDLTYVFTAPAIVVASAGSGFKATYMGVKNITGDLQAQAFEQGAILTGMEQFYSNTVARDFDIHGLNLYVGAGGRFINGKGEEFMWNYHPTLGNRANLQNLAVAFSQEVDAGRGPISLDITTASEEDQALCRKILPESFKIWDRAGTSPFAQAVPWMVALRGTNAGGGGLKIDLDCATNIKGLFGAGDICWIAPHGVYSFGGINIGFTSVSGYVAGKRAAAYRKSLGTNGPPPISLAAEKARMHRRAAPLTRAKGLDPEEVLLHMQEVIVPYQVAYLKDRHTLERALTRLSEIATDEVPRLIARSGHDLVKAIEIENMVTLAKLMVHASLIREESRGFHFRREFQYTDNENWLKRILLWKGPSGEVLSATEAVDTPFVRPTETRSLPPGAKKPRSVAMERAGSHQR